MSPVERHTALDRWPRATVTCVLVALCGLGGCTLNATLYDLETGAVLQDAVFRYSASGSGTVRIRLLSGEVLNGEYRTVSEGGTWGQIFGNGVSGMVVSPGMNRGVAVAASPEGTVLECEYVASGSDGYGICRDNKGKRYRLIF